MSINMSINFVYIVAGLKLLKTGNLQYETEDVLPVCFNPPRDGLTKGKPPGDGVTKGKQQTCGKVWKMDIMFVIYICFMFLCI